MCRKRRNLPTFLCVLINRNLERISDSDHGSGVLFDLSSGIVRSLELVDSRRDAVRLLIPLPFWFWFFCGSSLHFFSRVRPPARRDSGRARSRRREREASHWVEEGAYSGVVSVKYIYIYIPIDCFSVPCSVCRKRAGCRVLGIANTFYSHGIRALLCR